MNPLNWLRCKLDHHDWIDTEYVLRYRVRKPSGPWEYGTVPAWKCSRCNDWSTQRTSPVEVPAHGAIELAFPPVLRPSTRMDGIFEPRP